MPHGSSDIRVLKQCLFALFNSPFARLFPGLLGLTLAFSTRFASEKLLPFSPVQQFSSPSFKPFPDRHSSTVAQAWRRLASTCFSPPVGSKAISPFPVVFAFTPHLERLVPLRTVLFVVSQKHDDPVLDPPQTLFDGRVISRDSGPFFLLCFSPIVGSLLRISPLPIGRSHAFPLPLARKSPLGAGYFAKLDGRNGTGRSHFCLAGVRWICALEENAHAPSLL